MSEKWVVLSDLHGNAPALEQVIEQEGEDSDYIILGDLMGLCAYPKETLELVQEVGDYILAGNHDKAIFHKGVGHVMSEKLSEFELSHTINNLSHEQIDWMQKLNYLDVIERGGQRICITHAMPWPDMASGFEAGNSGVEKRDVTSVASVVSNNYDWVFHGHTHEQYDLDCAKFGHDVHFVNPGSLGYENTYSVVDTETGSVEHKSVEYDEDVEAHIQEVLPPQAPPTSEWY